MSTLPTPPVAEQRLFTRAFVTVVAAGLAYFLSLGMLLPVVPRYVDGPLDGSELAVGVVVGGFAAGAVAIRPLAGRLGDRRGRRILVVAGALIVAVAVLGHHLAQGIVPMFLVRVLGGFGEAAFFVGAGTMVTDLAPLSRRGEAISYWSIAVYGGLAFGPSLGEWLLDGDRFGLVWTVSAGLALLSVLIGLATTETVRPHAHDPEVPPTPLIHRAALPPGLVLFLGIVGMAGFFAFVPLYVDELGMEDSSGVFLLYGCTVLAVRILGARIPDRIGPLRAGSFATVASAAGLLVVAAAGSSVGLHVGTFVFALGMSLLYPAVLTLALTGVPERERGAAVGTVSSFFDLSQGLGAALLGIAVGLAGHRGAFVTAAAFSLLGLALLRSRVGHRGGGEVDHEAAAAAREQVEREP